MVTGKTFFSYSRDDSEFVLKLAKDLRAAGADVWLDQLDIGAGKRWDAEIETALENSQGQLVILSPSSVESNNVMDEVSYALEKGKHVIPILFKECQIPFRLKRLQYLDFTGNYETGFNQLLKSLNLGKKEETEKIKSVPAGGDTVILNEE
ncbi:MAG: toll/interleukin-1 receptor domain-containing protein, partial [Ignavibacteriaceae bacterium]